MRLRTLCLFYAFLCASPFCRAQSTSILYKERFDSAAAPKLPFGWQTSVKRSSSGDFITSASSPRSGSPPNCLSATDARVNQWVISPTISFADKIPDTLEFYERRTGTFTAGLLVEASIDGDTLFPIGLTDTLTLTPANNGAYQRRALPLPDTLNGQTHVRFRWRIAGIPGGGGTAVLRLEDLSISVQKTKDIALTSLHVHPPVPRAGDVLTVTAGVTNRAFPGSYSGTAELWDSVTAAAVARFTHFLAAQESLAITMEYPGIAAGRHPLTARLVFDADEDTTNNSRSIVVNVAARQRSVLINEFMYSPASGMPEWVELVNNSADTIPLAGWKISDAGATKALISGMAKLFPFSYAVVTTDTNGFKTFFDVPAPLFQASFSALNNSGDAVVLYDRFGSTVDSVSFLSSWGGGSGRSLERYDTSSISALQSSWSSSRHPDGATPGTINSITPKEFDAAVRSIVTAPTFPSTEMPVSVSVTIANTGRNNLSPLSAALLIDANGDGIPGPDEKKQESIIALLAVGDSATVFFTPEYLPQGKHRIFCTVASAQDSDTSDNSAAVTVAVGVPPASIVITEIMFAPDEGMPEWFEAVNMTNVSIDISGWTVSDNGSTRTGLSTVPISIPPGSYFIAAADSLQFVSLYGGTFPVLESAFSSLNNTTPDAVVLRDDRGMTIDSVRYAPHWGGDGGQSLQRYDPYAASTDSINWRSAVPSAGILNPIGRKEIDAEIRSILTIKTVNGVRIIAGIRNCGRTTMEEPIVSIFHDRNMDSIPSPDERLASQTAMRLLPLDSASLIFDWEMSLRGKVQIITVIEHPLDQRPANNTGVAAAVNNYPAQSIIINEVMYEPLQHRPEFVELLNRSSDTIDVTEWKLLDQPNSSGSRTEITLATRAPVVLPGGLVLIASDSSVFTHHRSLHDSLTVINSSLSLSNSGEEIILVDLTGKAIDSLRYSPSWHLKHLTTAGRSLERIDPAVSSLDRKNWSSSVAFLGSTPQQRNSIFIGATAASSSLSLSPNPFSPDQDGFEDFLSINYSIPAGSTTIRVRIFDVTGRLVRRLVLNEPSPSSGSVIWNGQDDDGNRVRIGMYIILFEALDHFGGNMKTMKDVAVAARRLK